MQTHRLKSIVKLVSYNGVIQRNVAVASTTPNETVNLKPWSEIPGPRSLPIIGIVHHFLPGGSLYQITNYDISKRIHELYGPIVRLDGAFGQPSLIFLDDPDCCERVLRAENVMPVRPGFQSLEYYRKIYKKKRGDTSKTTGLITDHGDTWKEFRSTVNPVLLQPKTIKLYADVLEQVADDMILRLKSIRDEKDMIQKTFDGEMNLWALESIATVALGIRLNCFDPNLPEDCPEKQLITCVHDFFEIAEKLDFKPSLWRYIWTPMYDKAMRLYEHHENVTRQLIKKGIKELEKKNDNSKEKGVLAKLLEINEEFALIMASDLLFAGVDTINIVFSHYNMSMTESQYVRSNEFLPERWISDKDDPLYYRNAHPFAYAPFGFGVRSCVGRRIAELEVETLLSKMMENFRVDWIGPPPQVSQVGLNYIKGPFNFVLKDL